MIEHRESEPSEFISKADLGGEPEWPGETKRKDDKITKTYELEQNSYRQSEQSE